MIQGLIILLLLLLLTYGRCQLQKNEILMPHKESSYEVCALHRSFGLVQESLGELDQYLKLAEIEHLKEILLLLQDLGVVFLRFH